VYPQLDIPIDGAARWLLVALLILWAGLLAGGLLLGKPDASRRNRLPLPARMALSTTLLAAALVWWQAGTAGTPLAGYGLWITAGMALGLLGDVFMAGLIVPKPRHVIFGMAAFGAGHVGYIAAYRQAAGVLELAAAPVWLASIASYLTAALLLWLLLVRQPGRGRALNYGTLAYSLLLAAMAGCTMALAVQDAAFAPLALGGLLFMASDLILGNELMRKTFFPRIGDVIWTTYTVAQMLIVYSSSAALQALPG
jgi:hypothetical protein